MNRSLLRPSSLSVFLLCSLLFFSCKSSESYSISYQSKSKNNPGYRTGKKKKNPQKKIAQKKAAQKKKSTQAMSQRSNKQKSSHYTKSKPYQPVRTQQSQSEFAEANYENCNASLSYLVQAQACHRKSLHIKVDKSDYKLSVYSTGRLIKEYPVVFGSDPVGDKLMQGDKRTPEGNFKVRAYYPHDEWEKFVWINYPTQESYQKHQRAKTQGKIPVDASIGGSIGIHGVPDNQNYAITERLNWTLGCIAMKNQDINELYPYVTKEMSIQIFE